MAGQDPFTRKASDKEGGSYERPAAGTYPAVCVAVVDLGTHTKKPHPSDKNQDPYDARDIYFAWELTGENDSEGNAFVVGQRLTNSLGKKANLRKLVESWTGSKLGDGHVLDFRSLLEKPCMIGLVENNGHVNIGSIGPVIRGYNVPPPTRDPFVFTLNEVHSSATDPDIPDWLPWSFGKSVLEIVKDSHEFKDLPGF